MASLDDDKAENIVSINLEGRAVLADFLVIATGLSKRHLNAMSTHIQKNLKKIGVKSISVEGANQCDWILLDAGNIIIHLFRQEMREFYNLEKMWFKHEVDGTSIEHHAL